MKDISVKEIINKVVNGKTKDTYLQIINIGMLLFHNSSRATTLINGIKINKKIDENSEIINANNIVISAIKNNQLYINILDESNKLLLLENLLIDINYFYNIKYKKITKNLVFDYINLIECEEIIKLIVSIASEIDDNNIMELLDEINIKGHNISYNSQLQTNIIRPLYDFIKVKRIKYNNIADNDNVIKINSLLNNNLEIDDPYKLSENYRLIRNIIKKISS